MSSKNTIPRETLVKIAALVRPALSTQTFIPAYQHIAFDGASALTHNDISAIQVRAELPIECCVPGELLIKTLASFSGPEILLQEGEDKTLLVVSGRSRLKLPTLRLKDFPFQLDDFTNVDAEVFLDAEIIKGIDLCLVSAGSSPNHPAQMGVTLDSENGCAVLFATDNATISRYETKTKLKLPGDAPVILPTFFCNQLIALAKTFSKESKVLLLMAGGLACEFGKEATLFTKTLVDIEPIDFPRIISKHVNLDTIIMDPIPSAFDSSFNRALLVQGAEPESSTEVVFQNGHVALHSSTQMGDCDDSFPFDTDSKKEVSFKIDPKLVIRGAKSCSMLHLARSVVVLGTEDRKFTHLIAHRT